MPPTDPRARSYLIAVPGEDNVVGVPIRGGGCDGGLRSATQIDRDAQELFARQQPVRARKLAHRPGQLLVHAAREQDDGVECGARVQDGRQGVLERV